MPANNKKEIRTQIPKEAIEGAAGIEDNGKFTVYFSTFKEYVVDIEKDVNDKNNTKTISDNSKKRVQEAPTPDSLVEGMSIKVEPNQKEEKEI